MSNNASAIDIQPFLDALSDKDLHIRATAAKILGKLRNPAAIPSLITALFDPTNTYKFTQGLFFQKTVQNVISEALVSIGGAETVAAFAELLESPDKNWRLMGIGLLKLVAQGRDQMLSGIAILQGLLKDPDLEIRSAAMEAIREIIFFEK